MKEPLFLLSFSFCINTSHLTHIFHHQYLQLRLPFQQPKTTVMWAKVHEVPKLSAQLSPLLSLSSLSHTINAAEVMPLLYRRAS
jgi:hypothetical protein